MRVTVSFAIFQELSVAIISTIYVPVREVSMTQVEESTIDQENERVQEVISEHVGVRIRSLLRRIIRVFH